MNLCSSPPGAASDLCISDIYLEFGEDVFGPVKALQLFAAINVLPDNYEISRARNRQGWTVTLTVKLTRRVERVLSNIRSLPALQTYSHKDCSNGCCQGTSHLHKDFRDPLSYQSAG